MDTIKINRKDVKMIAHRGLSGIERENTNPAFIAAANRSYYGIETDVHKTKDGKYVIIHDETTKRVTNGMIDINVEESSYDEVENIVLPDLDGSTNRKDIRIPLLIDYIKICKKYNKICVLELKNAFYKNEIEEIIKIIDQEQYLENVIFISFVLENCLYIREILPEHPVQWLIGTEMTEEMKQTLYKNNLGLDIQYRYLNRELVTEMHAHHILINCWTCDKKEEAEALVEMGVDFITSNILE